VLIIVPARFWPMINRLATDRTRLTVYYLKFIHANPRYSLVSTGVSMTIFPYKFLGEFPKCHGFVRRHPRQFFPSISG
jgi:hypothetical protein